MWLNPQETEDLVTFTEDILHGKLDFLCNEYKTIENKLITINHQIQRGLNKKEIYLNLCKIFSILIFNEFYLFA